MGQPRWDQSIRFAMSGGALIEQYPITKKNIANIQTFDHHIIGVPVCLTCVCVYVHLDHHHHHRSHLSRRTKINLVRYWPYEQWQNEIEWKTRMNTNLRWWMKQDETFGCIIQSIYT